MKAYVITTGVIFAAITIAHLMRIVAEPRTATEPCLHSSNGSIGSTMCLGLSRLATFEPMIRYDLIALSIRYSIEKLTDLRRRLR